MIYYDQIVLREWNVDNSNSPIDGWLNPLLTGYGKNLSPDTPTRHADRKKTRNLLCISK